MSRYLDAAYAILRKAGGPLAAGEIVRMALKEGLIVATGSTPGATMGALLYTDIKRDGSRFAKSGPGLFRLSGVDASPAGKRAQGDRGAGAKEAGKRPAGAAGKARYGGQQAATPPYALQDIRKIDEPSGNDYQRRIGAAGELRVMSELLLRGYNADHITIDNGIDIRATKGRHVYEIQVKTVTELKTGNKFVVTIRKDAFERAGGPQVYYVFVLRNRHNGITYVTASNKAMKTMIENGSITTNKAGYQAQFTVKDESLFLRNENVDEHVNDWDF